MHGIHLLSEIGIAIVAATAAALIARALRQPLILGYLLAGVAVGPAMGLGLVEDRESFEIISEIGVFLLLFIIGLEMDLQKLMSAGRSLVLAGLLQFPLCVALGLGFALALGLPLGEGRFDAAYAAVAMALSSTMIVVKLLYDKHELMTLPWRLTLGVLVFQDVWAILVLAVQPTLLDPSTAVLISSLFKGALLVAVSLAASRYALPALFSFIAKVPELMLVTALAWCFFVAGLASALGLSREMGALIAGVGMSTFPYNLDVIAKVVNIRDFFVTLFFVALGMQIPMPTRWALGVAAGASAFLVATRFLTVFPILYSTRCGLRTSLLPAINLSQMSEFSLVIAALGLALGHIDARTVAVLTFVFVITSVLSTYMIAFNHELQDWLARLARRAGASDPQLARPLDETMAGAAGIVFLGFYRDASSIVHQFEMEAKSAQTDGLLGEILVVDFNPQVLDELKRRRIRCVYGDVASVDTLHHLAVHHARIIACTLTDSILKGTTNAKLHKQLRRLCPEAAIVVASETIPGALTLYAEGADFVFIPRIHSAYRMAEVLRMGLEDGLAVARAEEMTALAQRDEVLA
jgi:Kef-type K+ transport system membrane component KefB